MPTSPKTAKEILQKLEQDFYFIHNGCPFPPGPWIGHEYKEQIQRFIVEAMRAAVEAVRPENPDFDPRYEYAQRDFDANVSRFFNDDPTSPPTPRN